MILIFFTSVCNGLTHTGFFRDGRDRKLSMKDDVFFLVEDVFCTVFFRLWDGGIDRLMMGNAGWLCFWIKTGKTLHRTHALMHFTFLFRHLD